MNCKVCNSSASKKCSICNESYCSSECQKKDWPAHKKICKKSLKIGFYLPHLDIQGTGVSSFDYAYYNEKILGNKTYFFYDENHQWSHPLAIKKFRDNLEIIPLKNTKNMSLKMKELEDHCKRLKIDAMYMQKLGHKQDQFLENIPTFVHCVGIYNEPHGVAYAYVSEWSSIECSGGKLPWVPYMVDLPDTKENLRKEFGIPEDAIVFGRTGGPYSWNIPFVNEVIVNVLSTRNDVWFLFVNTPKFIDHPRVLFKEPFADLVYKRKFINTCDAFLHARYEGESFGASVAEFSTCNKPVITYKNSKERNHLFVLGNKALLYEDKNSLLNIIQNFKKEPEKDWNAYKDFTPEKVMKKFKEVFIDKLENH